MRKLLAALLTLCALWGAAAAEDFGQSYDRFLRYYEENITFINENDGRFLIPLSASGAVNEAGCRVYRFESGALSTQVTLDDLGSQVASCLITLTAPAGMQYGDSQYADFTVSALHSYALLMAMHGADSPYDRYALVTEVNAAFANGSDYATQVGDYRLTCHSDGQTATMLFENELLLTTTMEEEDSELPTVEIHS